MSYTCHYVVWRCFLLTTIIWYLQLWGLNAFCHRSSVGASHFEFHTSKHWVSTLGYMVSMKIWKLYYIALYWKQIFYLFFPLLLELLTLQSWQCNCLIALDFFFFLKSNVREAFFPPAMLTQVIIEWLTAKMPFRLYTNVPGTSVPKTIDYLCFKKGFITDRWTIC